MEFEQRRKLEELHEMFQTEAWAYLVKTIEETASAGGDIRNIKDIETLFFLKGKLSVLDELKMLPSMVGAQLDDAI